MAFTAECSKCKRQSSVRFDFDSGQKIITCSCGNIAEVSNFSFDSQPEFLFKYRPYDQYTESWILNEELFFASPAVFNDPFDSKVMHTFEGTLEQKKRYLSDAFEIKFPGIKKQKKWDLIERALRDGILDKDYDGHITRMQQRVNEYGVLSFSRKPNDLLMFAYYAKDHSGYCLKYHRLADNVLSMARAVTYEERYPKFSLLDSEFRKPGALGDKVLFTKAECWEHEDEWRISFVISDKRAIKSPHPILEGIILGCNMKQNERDKIIGFNKRRSKPVEIFEARKKKFEFALEIVPLSF